MKIANVKVWFKVRKEIVEPMTKVRKILLNSHSKEEVQKSTLMMNSVANTFNSIINLNLDKDGVGNKLEAYIGNKELYKEILNMKIAEESSQEIIYFNYVVERLSS